MGSDRYNFSSEMKEKAHKKAQFFEPEKPKNVHHIFPKFFANKYNLPTALVRNEINAIALEVDLHNWIHGKRLTKLQLRELLGNELTKLDEQIDDEEIEWKGFEEDDYIFLAVALLGIAEGYFDKQRVYQRKPKTKRRKRRH